MQSNCKIQIDCTEETIDFEKRLQSFVTLCRSFQEISINQCSNGYYKFDNIIYLNTLTISNLKNFTIEFPELNSAKSIIIRDLEEGIYIYIYIYMFRCMYVCMYVYGYMYVCMYVCMLCMFKHVCMYVCI